jgi:hypothetical protein
MICKISFKKSECFDFLVVLNYNLFFLLNIANSSSSCLLTIEHCADTGALFEILFGRHELPPRIEFTGVGKSIEFGLRMCSLFDLHSNI